MRTNIIIAFLLVSALGIVTGCGATADDTTTTTAFPTAVDGSQYLLSDEPDEAIGVIAARESASDGDSLVVVGRIGGTANPWWVEGRAAFTLLDASLTLVAEGTESCEGELCTGDCCAAERAHATMLVKLVDSSGRVLAADSRHLLGIAENDMLVVRGSAAKDQSGNVALVASGIFIRR